MDLKLDDFQLGDAVHRMKEALLSTPGDTDPQVRREIEARVARLSGRMDDDPPAKPSASGSESLPPAVLSYVEKVAFEAFSITDQDLESLAKLGYSDDAIFEITLSAALGAGLGRLDRGLFAVKESE